MENFKKLLEKKNIDDVTNFLKNSDVDLLRTIAKRYKIPGSTKKKELIISSVLQAVRSDITFKDEPPLHQLTISQLKNKARELNIDYSSLHRKQDLRLAIINKTKQMQAQQLSQEPVDSTDQLTNEFLKTKSLPYLKALAKKYKIKVSKLSKNQLITLILEKQVLGESPKSLDIGQKNILKLKKNELVVMAEEMGLVTKGVSKDDIIKMIHKASRGSDSSEEEGIVVSTTTTSPKTQRMAPLTLSESIEITADHLPMSSDLEKTILNDRRYTVTKIKEVLKKFNIKIPRGTVKRNDLIHLLTIPSNIQIVPPNTPTSVVSQEKTKNKSKRSSRQQQSEVIQQSVIQKPSSSITQSSKRRKTPISSDVVSLDDIQSPFSPVPLGDLLEEPTEKQLQDELYRCLQFYEYPE
jgi:hypothetical protein